MTGLREKQKAMRRSAITHAALELFVAQGYDATTVEQIAEQAQVSAQTIFKYFRTKQEIVLDLLQETDQKALDVGRERMASFDDPIEAICYLDALISDYELQVMPASLWRELLPLWSNDMPQQLSDLTDSLIESISVELQKLQARGLIRQDLDTRLLAQLLNGYSSLRFTRLAREAEPDFRAHSEHMRQVITLIVQGLRT